MWICWGYWETLNYFSEAGNEWQNAPWWIHSGNWLCMCCHFPSRKLCGEVGQPWNSNEHMVKNIVTWNPALLRFVPQPNLLFNAYYRDLLGGISWLTFKIEVKWRWSSWGSFNRLGIKVLSINTWKEVAMQYCLCRLSKLIQRKIIKGPMFWCIISCIHVLPKDL